MTRLQAGAPEEPYTRNGPVAELHVGVFARLEFRPAGLRILAIRWRCGGQQGHLFLGDFKCSSTSQTGLESSIHDHLTNHHGTM